MLDGKSHTVVYSKGEIAISKDEIIVQRTELEGVKVINDGSLTVGFDTKVTQELLEEGIARDIVRSIQNLRKESGFEVSDRIRLTWDGDDVWFKRVFEALRAEYSKRNIVQFDSFATLDGEAIDCGDHMLRLG
jgi:isoleucyl-tRNA synthetase